MKTNCYCTFCTKHPLHSKRNELPILTGFRVGHMILGKEFDQVGKEVECLKPESEAFEDYDIDPEEHKFPDTAYNDGGSETGFDNGLIRVYAYCGNEDYED